MLCRTVVEPGLQDDSEFLYAEQPELLQYRMPQLTVEKAVDWYRSRAEEIEHHAGQVRRESTAAHSVHIVHMTRNLRCDSAR